MGKKRFQIEFDFEANMGQVKSSVEDLKKSLSGISMPANLASGFEKLFGKLESEMSEFQALTKNGFANMADVGKAQTAFAKISKLLNQLGVESSKIKGIDPNKFIPKEAQTRISSLSKKLGELQSQQSKKDGYAEKIEKQTKALEAQRAAVEKLKTRQEALKKTNTDLGASKGATTKKRNDAQARKADVVSRMTALEGQKGGKSSAEYKDLSQELTNLNRIIGACNKEIVDLTSQITKNKSAVTGLEGDIENAESSFKDLEKELDALKSIDIDPKALRELREELAQVLSLGIDEIPEDLNGIQTAIDGIKTQQLDKIAEKVEKITLEMHQVDDATDGARAGLEGVAKSAEDMDRAASDVENLKNQFLQFFSLTNSVQLFRRAISSALETVKELDATMTEAAVVTEFDVGDMWDKLPQYSKEAQQLGVSINGMYQATTLYYQQGLKTNEAMQLGIETMKMAKIAGMESAEATEAMTAALRGFNMELNEMSATRVNDVYSQLAAVTAADTSQIATAMEKTASIAASANMEFETTAALLAQIIETTQEAPETAGTAMKTIIARFSEVKSLRAQGQTKGTDSEGEGIDVNKIQTALATVGISMEGFFAGTEGLDSILLKLAEKWDTLDFETQRYIATMAAGSRQQSRFIAMMSDYGRTTELVGEANNSAGASQRQFNKTLDSMESKLQKLKNAWDEFLMGLANNVILKGAIDTLTFVLTTINKITDAISGGSGLIKSVVSLATVIGGLKLGKSLLGGALGWTGQQMGIKSAEGGQDKGQGPVSQITPNPQQEGQQAGQKAGAGFFAGFKNGLASAKGGGSFIKGFITQELDEQQQHRVQQGKGATALKKKYGASTSKGMKADYLKEIQGLNQGLLDDGKLKEVEKAYDDVLAGSLDDVGSAVEAANKKVDEFNGKLYDSKDASQEMGVNLGAIGGAALAAGGAMGMLASLFDSMGLEGTSKAFSILAGTLMGVGTVIQIVSALAPVMGMSFTTAGAQIGAAGWAAITPWLPFIGIIVAIVAGAAALILIFVLVAKAIKDASDEAQLEKMNKGLEKLTEAADQAKEKFEELTDARKDLDDMANKLKNLTKGTREWREALIETNSKVLELIGTYPELAKYIEKGESGELAISDEGWDKVLDEQMQTVVSTQSAVLAQQNAIAQKENYKQIQDTLAAGRAAVKGEEKDWSQTKLANVTRRKERKAEREAHRNANREAKGKESKGGANTIMGGLTAGDFSKFAAAAAESGLSLAAGSGKAEFKALFESLEIEGEFDELWQAMENTGEAFDQVSVQAMASAEAEKARVKAIAQTQASGSKIISESKDFGEAATEFGAQLFEGVYADKIAEKASEYVTKTGWLFGGKKVNQADNVAVMEEYARMMKMTLSEVKEQVKKGDLDYETIKRTLGADKVDKEMLGAMEGVVNGLNEITRGSKEKKRKIGGLLSEEGLGLTTKDIEKAKSNGGLNSIISTSEIEFLANSMGVTVEELTAKLSANYTRAVEAYENAFSPDGYKIEGLKSNLEGVFGALGNVSLTVDQVGTLAQSLAQVEIQGGAYRNLTALFDDLTTGLGGNELQTAVELLAETDWTNQASIMATVDSLRSLGVAIDENLIQKVTNAAGVLNNLSFDDFSSNLSDRKVVRDNIQSKILDGSNTFTEEEIAQLSIYGYTKDDFVMTDWGEYVFMDDTNKILEKINSDTSTMLDKMVADAGEAVRRGEGIAKFTEKLHDETKKVDPNLRSAYNAIMMGTAFTEGGKQLSDSEMDAVVRAIGMDPALLIGTSGKTRADAIRNYVNTWWGDSGEKLEESRAAYKKIEEGSAQYGAASKIGQVDFLFNEQYTEEQKNNALDAYLKTQTGATKLADVLQNSLGEAYKDETMAVKNLAVATYQTAKKFDAFNSVLQEHADGLAIADETDGQYRVSLEKITAAAKSLFGSDLTSEFVENNRQAFLDLAKGGAVAEKAYKKLRLEYVKTMLLTNYPEQYTQYGASLVEMLETLYENIEVGVAVNFTPLISSVNGLSGIDKNLLQQVIDAAGFDITVDSKGNIIGTKEDIEGTGMSPFEQEKWENTYDKQYNTVKKINAELRKREQLEKQYQRLVNQNTATPEKLSSLRKQQEETLKAEKALRERALNGRKEELAEAYKKYSNVTSYAHWDEELGKVQLNQEALDQLEKSGDKAKGDRVDEYIALLERISDDIEAEQDAIDQIEDDTYELATRGMDEYLQLEQDVKQALIDEKQAEIDSLSEINDSINDGNSQMLDAMQKQIDKYRQARDNQRTEEELIDKQQKIAYLSQDTSGANAAEIMRLQKELDQGIEDHTDALIDQKISDLQEQNDKAAEQRQRQIDIMNSQLEQYEKGRQIWEDVYAIIQAGTDSKNGLLTGSRLEELLKSGVAFESMSDIEQMKWLQDIQTQVSSGMDWIKEGAYKTLASKQKGEIVSVTDKDGNTVTGVMQDDLSIKTANGVLSADKLSSGVDGKYYYSELFDLLEEEKEDEPDGPPELTENDKKGVSAAIWNGTGGWGSGKTRSARLKEVFGDNDIQKNYVNKGIKSGYTGSLAEYSYEKMKAKYSFKTGGLADFTGPAWLDGTKSKPEYVLNSKQTEAFLTLVDVLSGLRTSSQTSTSTENHGDNVYDIDINIESIGDDYSVEQMAQAVKRLITDDAMYRNTNAINLKR